MAQPSHHPIEDDDAAEEVRDVWASSDDLPFDLDQFGELADEIDAYPMDGCKITRGDRTLQPFVGQQFWVHPVTPAKLANAFMRFAGGVQENNASEMALPFRDLCDGLSRCVVGWDLVDALTGEPFPQPFKNAAVFEDIPTEALYWILQTVTRGETPDARPNASTPRRGGSGTRRSTGRKIRSTSTAPRHR